MERNHLKGASRDAIGTVNLPNGGHAQTGPFPWRCAAMPGSAISRQATIASERSARSPDDDMA
jgi:hypothetical protein